MSTSPFLVSPANAAIVAAVKPVSVDAEQARIYNRYRKLEMTFRGRIAEEIEHTREKLGLLLTIQELEEKRKPS